MDLSNLQGAAGSTQSDNFRRGRGHGSGNGKTAGKGLRSHLLSMKETLLAGGGMGRKLDFIAQEMNREANTILSKTTDLKVSDVGINLKTDIEKVREQIQNIE